MQRRTPLIRAAGAQVSSGLQPDVHGLLGVLWEAAENVTFYAGKVRRRIPSSLVHADFGVVAAVRSLSQQQGTTGTRWIWAASGVQVRRWYGPASEHIFTFPVYYADATATQLATMPDFTHFGDWTVINSSVGAAKLYKDGAPPSIVDYPNAPTDVTAFQKKLNFMMAYGYGGRGTRVGWSDADDIETWTPAEDNAAGSLSIEDLDTPIRAICRLGNATAVYSEDQLALVTYISAPFYFGQRVVLDGIGCVGKKAVAGDGQSNYGISRNGIWRTDGVGFRYLDTGLLRDYLQANVNWAQANKAYVARNDYRGTFEFFFPMLGSGTNECTEGWSYDPATGGWGPIPAYTMKDERRLFSRPIGGRVGQVLLDEDDATVASPLTLRTKPMSVQVRAGDNMTDAHVVAKIDEVQMYARVATEVEFRIGSLMDSGQTPSWSKWYAVPEGSQTVQVDVPADGVYHQLEFRNTADNWDLDLQGFMLWGLADGTKRSSQ